MSEPPEIKELNFDKFHPLDHIIASPYCWGWYGGPWNHLILWYDFIFSKVLESKLCKLGMHFCTEVYHYKAGKLISEDTECPYCGKVKEKRY